MPFGAPTLSAICPCPRELSRPGTRTATDTVRRTILTCADMQERPYCDHDSPNLGSGRPRHGAGRMTPRRPACKRPSARAPTIYLALPERLAELLQTSYGNTISSPVIVRLVTPVFHAPGPCLG